MSVEVGVRNSRVSARQELTVILLPILLAVHIQATKRTFHDAKHDGFLFATDMTSWCLKAVCMPTCGCSNRKQRKKKNMAASVIVLRREKTINKQRSEEKRSYMEHDMANIWS